MGIFNSLEDKYSIKKSGGENRQSINLPVLITGYEDNKFFLGQRLDTKEMVKVKLREDVVATGANPKPVVADFQDKKNKRYAPPNNAILLFDNAYMDEEGTWVSRWANTLHKPRMESKVLILNSTVRFVEESGSKYIQVRVIKSSRWINSPEELSNALIAALQPKGSASRPFAHIRLKSSDGSERIYTVSPHMIESNVDGEVIKVADTGENSYIEYQKQDKNKLILECCNLPEVTVEVLSGTSLYLGGDTRDKYFSNAALRKILEPAYLIDPAGKKTIDNYGYKKTVIAVREMPNTNGLMFVTEVKPLVNNSAAVSIMNLIID